MRRNTNEILEDHGWWVLIDISTDKHPTASMAVDKEVFAKHDGGRIYAVANKRRKYIYAKYTRNRKCIMFHHDVIGRKDGLDVDHIKHGNLSFIDNRSENLRLVTRSENQLNTSSYSTNTSGVKGVHWCEREQKWLARIGIGGKRKQLGYFSKLSEAKDARIAAETNPVTEASGE